MNYSQLIWFFIDNQVYKKLNSMIQLYSKKPIRILTEKDEIWFNAKDVYDSLQMVWRGGTGLRQEKRIPEKWIIQRGTETSGGLQNALYVNENALYKIAFTSKPKSEDTASKLDDFVNWVTDVIKEIRIHGKYELTSPIRIQKNFDIAYQKENSKRLNAKNYTEGGKGQTIEYNSKNILLHTGKTPTEIKQIGLDRGLKKSECQSAKEVVRKLRPDVAAGISFTDLLVNEDGLEHERAARISIKYGIPLFHALMDAGVKENRLIK